MGASETSMFLMVVGIGLGLFAVVVCSFFFGLHVGMVTGTGGSRGLFGPKGGRSYQLPEPQEDFSFGLLGSPPRGGASQAQAGGPGSRIMKADEAQLTVDEQVQRFIDSTVFGRGPARARDSGEGDDDNQ